MALPFLADAQGIPGDPDIVTPTPPADAPGGGGGGGSERDSSGLGGAIEGLIYSFCVGVGGIFLWIGGSLLDYAIQFLVIGMGEFLKANLGVIIDQLWVVVRDFFNILFIFGLIYIGFRTILGIGDNDTKKAVGYLIIAALMINFSLFITKAIIDFSNIAAFQVYNAIIAGQQGSVADLVVGADIEDNRVVVTDDGVVRLGGDVGVRSISASFMGAIRISTYADGSAINAMRNDADYISGRFIFFGIAMMFFMLFAAFVFAAGAMLLISRFIALIFFMIFSPFMFMAWIFPKFKEYGEKWWHDFLRYAFVAPAYLFMLYLSLWAISGISTASGGSFATAFSGDADVNGTFFIIMYFFVVTGFLVASLKVAEKMGVAGASASITATKYLRNFAGASTFGLAARGLRNTVGYTAQKIAESDSLKDAASKSGFSSFAARATMRGASVVGDSSFDLRNNVKMDVLGGNLGEGKKGGFATRLKEAEQSELKFAKQLGEVGDDDEEVKKIQGQIDSAENELTRLKETPSTDKAEIAAQQRNVDELYKQKKAEKARRQIGRKEDREKYDTAVAARDKAGGEVQKIIKVRLNNNAGREVEGVDEFLNDVQLEEYKALENNKKQQRAYLDKVLKEAEKFAAEQLKKRAQEATNIKRAGYLGYANVLETSGPLESVVTGRILAQERSAGKAIRKQYESKIKQSKDDERFNNLSEKIETTAKKDD